MGDELVNELQARERRSKLLELVRECSELEPWLDKNDVLHKGVSIESSPLSKIELLGILYFPELERERLCLGESTKDYEDSAKSIHHDDYVSHLSSGSDKVFITDTEKYKTFIKARVDLLSARNLLSKAAITLASRGLALDSETSTANQPQFSRKYDQYLTKLVKNDQTGDVCL